MTHDESSIGVCVRGDQLDRTTVPGLDTNAAENGVRVELLDVDVIGSRNF
jgi:hypothetical protein